MGDRVKPVEKTEWNRRFAAYLDTIAENSDMAEWFVRDMTEYATEAWDYEPDVALDIARRSLKERDTYFALYIMGAARRKVEVLAHG